MSEKMTYAQAACLALQEALEHGARVLKVARDLRPVAFDANVVKATLPGPGHPLHGPTCVRPA